MFQGKLQDDCIGRKICISHLKPSQTKKVSQWTKLKHFLFLFYDNVLNIFLFFVIKKIYSCNYYVLTDLQSYSCFVTDGRGFESSFLQRFIQHRLFQRRFTEINNKSTVLMLQNSLSFKLIQFQLYRGQQSSIQDPAQACSHLTASVISHNISALSITGGCVSGLVFCVSE